MSAHGSPSAWTRRGHDGDRLVVGVDRFELVPAERGRHLRAGPGPHAPRAEDRLVRRVLVEVDEDALAALFLPPRVGDERWDAGARARARRATAAARTCVRVPPRQRAGRTRGCRGSRWSSDARRCRARRTARARVAAASRIISKSVPGCGSRSMRSSSACSGSSASDGHTWKPRHPRFTAHAMCASVGDHERVSTSCRSAC